MFNTAQLRGHLKKSPFVPFRIFTASGQSCDVTHPDLMLIGATSVIIGMASNDDPAVYTLASEIAMFHITDIQQLPRESLA